jgi:hypothetical protein
MCTTLARRLLRGRYRHRSRRPPKTQETDMSTFEFYNPRPRFAAMAGGSPLSEQQETELAAEALEIYREEELEEFVGNVLEGVATGAGESIQRAAVPQLGGVLKGIGAATLPAGGALVSLMAPTPGELVGSKLGWMIDRTLELELEGMDREDAELERARRYVGLVATSARHAALATPTAPPRLVAQSALADALAEHVPDLFEAAVTGKLSPYQDKPDPKGRPRLRALHGCAEEEHHHVEQAEERRGHQIRRSPGSLSGPHRSTEDASQRMGDRPHLAEIQGRYQQLQERARDLVALQHQAWREGGQAAAGGMAGAHAAGEAADS